MSPRWLPWPERFWAQIDRLGPDECWPWLGATHNGYGKLHVGETTTGPHRMAYELIVGAIPKGMTLDHLCHDPDVCTLGTACTHRRCCNPAHLEPATVAANTLRGNSSPAINARKTICKRGHPLVEENVYVSPLGYRTCRICKNMLWREFYDRRRQAA